MSYSQHRWRCPRCGANNMPGVAACHQCGAPSPDATVAIPAGGVRRRRPPLPLVLAGLLLPLALGAAAIYRRLAPRPGPAVALAEAATPPTTTVSLPPPSLSATRDPAYAQAVAAYRAGDWQTAKRRFRETILADSSFPAAHLGLSDTYLQLGDLDSANDAAHEARRILRADSLGMPLPAGVTREELMAQAYGNLAAVAIHRFQRDLAAGLAMEAIRLAPAHPRAKHWKEIGRAATDRYARPWFPW